MTFGGHFWIEYRSYIDLGRVKKGARHALCTLLRALCTSRAMYVETPLTEGRDKQIAYQIDWATLPRGDGCGRGAAVPRTPFKIGAARPSREKNNRTSKNIAREVHSARRRVHSA